MADGVFRERFADLLRERDMTQREIAAATNLTEGAISHYLKGDREPKGAILLNIANALGTSTDYLSGKSDEVRPDGSDGEVAEAYRLVARNARNMTAEEKERFIRALYTGGK